MTNRYDSHVPFLVKGGEMKDIIESVVKENTDTWNCWDEFKTNNALKSYYANHKFCAGVFEGRAPENWIHRKTDPPNGYVPKANTKLREEFESLPHLIQADGFTLLIKYPFSIELNNIRFAVFEHILKDTPIVWISKKSLSEGYVPPGDVIQLKVSEYFKLKEQGEEEVP